MVVWTLGNVLDGVDGMNRQNSDCGTDCLRLAWHLILSFPEILVTRAPTSVRGGYFSLSLEWKCCCTIAPCNNLHRLLCIDQSFPANQLLCRNFRTAILRQYRSEWWIAQTEGKQILSYPLHYCIAPGITHLCHLCNTKLMSPRILPTHWPLLHEGRRLHSETMPLSLTSWWYNVRRSELCISRYCRHSLQHNPANHWNGRIVCPCFEW